MGKKGWRIDAKDYLQLNATDETEMSRRVIKDCSRVDEHSCDMSLRGDP